MECDTEVWRGLSCLVTCCCSGCFPCGLLLTCGFSSSSEHWCYKFPWQLPSSQVGAVHSKQNANVGFVGQWQSWWPWRNVPGSGFIFNSRNFRYWLAGRTLWCHLIKPPSVWVYSSSWWCWTEIKYLVCIFFIRMIVHCHKKTSVTCLLWIKPWPR